MDRELNKYKELLPTLAADEGKFAPVCGDQLIGTYDSYQDALAIGYERCGLTPFLVKRISTTESISYYSRDLSGPCPT